MDAQDDREILAQEDRLTEATRNVDVAALDGLYADDIIFTGVTGAICDKHAVMDEARRGLAARLSATSPEAMAVVAYDKDEIRALPHDQRLDEAIGSVAGSGRAHGRARLGRRALQRFTLGAVEEYASRREIY